MNENYINLQEAVDAIVNGERRVKIEMTDEFARFCEELEKCNIGRTYFEGEASIYDYCMHWMDSYPYFSTDGPHHEAVCYGFGEDYIQMSEIIWAEEDTTIAEEAAQLW